MKRLPVSLLFPLLLTAALGVGAAAYQEKIRTANNSYARLKQTLEGINSVLQKGSRIYVTEHTGEELFRPQMPLFLPFNDLIWRDTVRGQEDSVLTVQKESEQTDSDILAATHRMLWVHTSAGFTAHLWVKMR